MAGERALWASLLQVMACHWWTWIWSFINTSVLLQAHSVYFYCENIVENISNACQLISCNLDFVISLVEISILTMDCGNIFDSYFHQYTFKLCNTIPINQKELWFLLAYTVYNICSTSPWPEWVKVVKKKRWDKTSWVCFCMLLILICTSLVGHRSWM